MNEIIRSIESLKETLTRRQTGNAARGLFWIVFSSGYDFGEVPSNPNIYRSDISTIYRPRTWKPGDLRYIWTDWKVRDSGLQTSDFFAVTFSHKSSRTLNKQSWTTTETYPTPKTAMATTPSSLETLTAEDHTRLRNEIDCLQDLTACGVFFDTQPNFQRCVQTLQKDFKQFKQDNMPANLNEREHLEAWASTWAASLASDHTAAWVLNHCRKTALKLVYKVCDLAPPSDNKQEEAAQIQSIAHDFGMDRLDEIVPLCVPLDRANCLNNMKITETGALGLGWYAKGEEKAYQDLKTPPLPLNPSSATINKRLKRLQKTLYAKNEVMNYFLSIAAPKRLIK